MRLCPTFQASLTHEVRGAAQRTLLRVFRACIHAYLVNIRYQVYRDLAAAAAPFAGCGPPLVAAPGGPPGTFACQTARLLTVDCPERAYRCCTKQHVGGEVTTNYIYEYTYTKASFALPTRKIANDLNRPYSLYTASTKRCWFKQKCARKKGGWRKCKVQQEE